jgi:hypothetical protein
LVPQVQRDTTISSLSRALGVSWKSLWQLNPDLPHPDYALQVLQPRACFALLPSFHAAHDVALQPASLFNIGRMVTLRQVQQPTSVSFARFLTRAHQARTLTDISSTFGCPIDTLLVLNNDMRNASAAVPVPALSSLCILPDSCLARTAQPAAAGFRDQDWFRASQTQRS